MRCWNARLSAQVVGSCSDNQHHSRICLQTPRLLAHVTGIPAAAILLTLLDLMARVQSRHQAIRAAAAGFVAVFGAAAALQVAADLLDRRVLQAPLMLFTLPCAFVGGAALFGVVAARLIYGRPFQFGAPAR